MTSAEVEQKRKRLRVTQQELASELGVYPQTLIDLAAGHLDDLISRVNTASEAIAARKQKEKEVSAAA